MRAAYRCAECGRWTRAFAVERGRRAREAHGLCRRCDAVRVQRLERAIADREEAAREARALVRARRASLLAAREAGESYAEIARRLGVGERTVRTQVRHARRARRGGGGRDDDEDAAE